MTEVLPNFFIVGAPKAGTTSLYHLLDQHPQIYMSPVKEPCYFASEIRPENFSAEHEPRIRREAQELRQISSGPMLEKRFSGVVSKWDDYLKLFQNATNEKAIGEASVRYLWSQTAAQNIISRVPNAKIIIVLRDPASSSFLSIPAYGYRRTDPPFLPGTGGRKRTLARWKIRRSASLPRARPIPPTSQAISGTLSQREPANLLLSRTSADRPRHPSVSEPRFEHCTGSF